MCCPFQAKRRASSSLTSNLNERGSFVSADVHDYVCDEAFWRSMDFGPVEVRIGARVPRVRCPVDGVVTAAVPWAKPGSRFTTDFAFSAAWMVKGGLNKKNAGDEVIRGVGGRAVPPPDLAVARPEPRRPQGWSWPVVPSRPCVDRRPRRRRSRRKPRQLPRSGGQSARPSRPPAAGST